MNRFFALTMLIAASTTAGSNLATAGDYYPQRSGFGISLNYNRSYRDYGYQRSYPGYSYPVYSPRINRSYPSHGYFSIPPYSGSSWGGHAPSRSFGYGRGYGYRGGCRW